MTMPNPRNTKEEVAARQGTKQKMNVRVLTTSLVLIGIIFAGLYFMFLASPHSENKGTAPSTERQESTSPPALAPNPAQPARP